MLLELRYCMTLVLVNVIQGVLLYLAPLYKQIVISLREKDLFLTVPFNLLECVNNKIYLLRAQLVFRVDKLFEIRLSGNLIQGVNGYCHKIFF